MNKPSLAAPRFVTLLILWSVVLTQAVWAQTFGNEWINRNQTYFKIPVGEDGIYRIGYTELQAAGFPVDNIDPRRLQLFFRGQEQAILVEGQQDARFDPSDFIIFYGQKNDGTQDRELYTEAAAQANPHYNLYSDSTAYFLTWSLAAVNGKRMSFFQENNISNIPAEAYHWEEKLQLLTSEFSMGRRYPLGSSSPVFAHLSAFDYGEGWTGPRLRQGESATYTVSAPSQYTAGPQPQLEILLTGRNNLPHDVTIEVGSSTASLRTLATVNFNYFDNYLLSENLNWSDLSGDNLTVRVRVNGVNGGADNVSVAYLRLRYPQLTTAADATQKAFTLAENAGGKSYLEISTPPSSPYLLEVTNENDVRRIGFNLVSGNLTTIIPDTQTERKILLGSTKAVPDIRPVDFQNISSAANYLIVSNQRLRVPAGNYSDPVQAYFDYRASPAGGGFTPVLFNIDQLYDQFSYGEPTPLAIRRLAAYLLSVGKPQYLLLLGKGLTVNFNYHRQNPATATLHDLVPPGGFPGSDVVLTAGLPGSDGYGSAIPTGRINAQNAAEVAAYLDKIKEMEARGLQADYDENTTREALWRKHLVHLSGGFSQAELSLFARYVDEFEAIARGHFLGGKVSTQSKQTNNASELINIAGEVNQGVSMVTFFGHSSPTITDIEVGYASNDELGYRNKGKYPLVLINGCNAGNIFTNTLTFGEDWIRTPERGAAHVIAHSAEGISSILKRYTEEFYATAFGDTLYTGASLGKVKDVTSRRFMEAVGSSAWEVHISQVQQTVTQGDPAVSIFGRALPDFEVNENSLSVNALEDAPVSVLSDSFAIDVVVRNFGRSSHDSLQLQLNRTLADGSVLTYGPVSYAPVLYEDTLQFVVRASAYPELGSAGFGNNRFEMIIDSGDSIPELNEGNNRVSLDFFVPLSGTVNLRPYDYAVVNEAKLKLHVQPGDAQTALRNNDRRDILIEIDTSYTFSSPIRQQYRINAGVLGSQEVTLPVTEANTVYYWRSKYANLREGELDEWNQSSFTYSPEGGSGWAQLQDRQLLENEVENMTYEQQWEFAETGLDVSVTTYGSDVDPTTAQLLINGRQLLVWNVFRSACRRNSINAVAFDKYSLFPYLGIKQGGEDWWDANSCGPTPQTINTFANSQVAGTALVLERYIDNIESGNPVLLFTLGSIDYSTWPASTMSKLGEIGVDASMLSGLPAGAPLIILGEKNAAPGTATLVMGDTTEVLAVTEQEVSLSRRITSNFSNGSILSRRVGPASAWSSLQMEVAAVEPEDIVRVDVIGETENGSQVMLFSDIDINAPLDLGTVDARQYPFLRLHFLLEDKVNLSPAQLQEWVISYRGVPEGVLLSENDLTQSISKQEGENFSLPFSFYNLSDVAFGDSLQVAYRIFSQDSRRLLDDTLRIEALAAGDTADFQIPVSTIGYVGSNDFSLKVNPFLQKEQNYNNNQVALSSYFEVSADKLNPIIDVAFDGSYIMDGDIVSPRPMITVEMRDENPYLQKQDTTGIDIFLGRREEPQNASVGGSNARTASSATLSRISLSSEQVSWSPATEEEPFRISYQPEQLENGMYTLRVQAEDASGNASGAEPYEINFEVINESSITNFYPYPNPFSTSTRFVFTLTGQEIPDQIKVQIMTVSGKVVREILQDELGPIRIGNNISQYAWDGRDEFGDELANGVYLYRVIVRSNGQAMEQRETAGDRGFKNGFGKLYILR